LGTLHPSGEKYYKRTIPVLANLPQPPPAVDNGIPAAKAISRVAGKGGKPFRTGRKPYPRDAQGNIIRPPKVEDGSPERLYLSCSKLVLEMVQRVKRKLKNDEDPSRVDVDLIKWILTNQPKQLKKKALSGNAMGDEGSEEKPMTLEQIVEAATEANDGE
jgi:hypothetical protein